MSVAEEGCTWKVLVVIWCPIPGVQTNVAGAVSGAPSTMTRRSLGAVSTTDSRTTRSVTSTKAVLHASGEVMLMRAVWVPGASPAGLALMIMFVGVAPLGTVTESHG